MNNLSSSQIILLLVGIVASAPLRSEIIFDGSTGTNGELQAEHNHYIITAEYGEQRGSALLHSFESFNLNSDEAAFFMGSGNIEHVISRVTGGQVSQIDGYLSSEVGQADFYFLNPAGIIFGNTAQLNSTGALYISTASSVEINGTVYFAELDTPEALSKFNIAPSSAFGFIDKPASIQTKNATFTVPDKQHIALIAGELVMENSLLSASGGKIDLHAVDGDIRVQSELEGNRAKGLNVSGLSPEGTHLSANNIALNNIVVNAENVTQIVPDETEPANTGEIILNAKQEITINNSRISASTYGLDNGANIQLDAPQIYLSGNTQIKTGIQGQGSGKSGDIEINTNILDMADQAIISGEARFSDALNGEINIQTSHLFMKDFSSIRNLTLASETDAGNINIDAEHVYMEQDATLDTSVYLDSTGTGGLISLSADSLIMKDSAWIISETFSSGIGGDIFINTNNMHVQDSIKISANKVYISSGLSFDAILPQTRFEAIIQSNCEKKRKGLSEINNISDFLTLPTDQLSGGVLGFYSDFLLEEK